MSKQLIDDAVLDTDWFLELPPKFKALYFMLRLTCSGVGFRSLGWRKLSNDLGETVSREEFDKHFHKLVAWLGPDEIWIHGRVAEQYKVLSPSNKAHVNMAWQVVEKTAGFQLSREAQEVVLACSRVLGLSNDTQSALVRESSDSQATVGGGSADPNITITTNNNKSTQGGAGETNSIPPEEPFHASQPNPTPLEHELLPEIQGEYSEAALQRMLTVIPGAQKAWLVMYPDGQWIREQASLASTFLDTSPNHHAHRKPWGQWFGGWLHRGWKNRGQSPPGRGTADKVPDYSQLT